jgi:hypothetical protein
LNEDYLQGIPAPNATNRLAMVFADCQQIDYTDRLTTGFSTERDTLPPCPRYNPSNTYLRHCDGPLGGALSFPLRFFPIRERCRLHHSAYSYHFVIAAWRAKEAQSDRVKSREIISE